MEIHKEMQKSNERSLISNPILTSRKKETTSFYEANITLIIKADKDTMKKENYRLYS